MTEKKEKTVSYTLTGLRDFLNKGFKGRKVNGKDFTVSDVQAYIKRGYLPRYLGSIDIVPFKLETVQGVKLYRLIVRKKKEDELEK